MRYFNNIIYEIKKKIRHREFYFDLEDVEEISVDAIMYILAVLRNIKGVKYLQYRFMGNQPSNEDARKQLVQSGFYRYLNTPIVSFDASTDKVQIIDGNSCNTTVAEEIYNFVSCHSQFCKKINTQLYSTLIELMSNTVQHAYKEEHGTFTKNWYIYVEDIGDRFKLVFLDTGVGIPRTIRKKMLENLISLSDAEYIISALLGEQRSETNEKNRGTGLPHVYKYGFNENIENFKIMSGKGNLEFISIQAVGAADLSVEFIGTLYTWEIKKPLGDD